MARQTAISINTIPIGPLGIIGMPGCEELTDKIDKYLVKWRRTQASEHAESIAFFGYQRDTYKIDVSIPRFGSGEGKGVINESVRGYDIYIVCDVFNYSCSYDMYGRKVYMSPDDHFADLKRVISALCSKPKRVSVIMPMLYEGRQHKRSSRESLDCAMALKELVHLGVENIITFDAHDQRVQNAIPDKSFENVMPTYQMIKALVNNVEDLNVDKDHLMIISPDEGAGAVYIVCIAHHGSRRYRCLRLGAQRPRRLFLCSSSFRCLFNSIIHYLSCNAERQNHFKQKA